MSHQRWRQTGDDGGGERLVLLRGDARGAGHLPARPQLHHGGGVLGAVAGGHREAEQVAALLRRQPHQRQGRRVSLCILSLG